MTTIIRLYTALFFLSFCITVNAQQVKIIQSNASGIYQKGEKVEVVLEMPNLEADSIQVKIDVNYSKNAEWKTIANPGEKLVLLSETFEEPAARVITVMAEGRETSTGFVVMPNKLRPSTKRPSDFRKYWKNEKQKLRALEWKIKSTKVEDTAPGYVCFDVELNCTGPKPARGYFAKPENAGEGTLPIVLNVHAAGVKGSWCLSKVETAVRYAEKGALSFDLNAHGMLNGQPQEYYDKLEEGELYHYWEIGAENREENYFRGMYLRLQRTLDFLCNQPEWDGKNIIVIGESQGGGQALVAAGLDDRVTAVVATVPAMCDFGRTLIGETGGWPNPFNFQKDKQKMLNTYPYFDAAHILKGCKATLVTEIGLIDYTCPSLGIYAAINQAKGEKITLVTNYRAHHLGQKQFQQEWEENIYNVRRRFIDDFLLK